LLRRVFTKRWAPFAALALLSILSLGARVPWVFDSRTQSPVFDEVYYVNAARVILGHPAQPPYSQATPRKDPNEEHPPLAKILIAGSIWALGDRPLGWRVPSLAFGTAAILAMFWLVRSAGGSEWLAVGSSAILVADNLFLVHSGIATLDIFVVFFMLVGAALYLSDHPIAAGVAIGVGACTKTVSLYLILVLLLYEILAFRGRPRANHDDGPGARIGRLAGCTACTVTSYLGLLWILDRMVSTFKDPVSHTSYMVGYHTRILDPNLGGPGITSSPWQWLFNQRPIPYYTLVKTVGNGQRRYAVFFLGKISPFVIWLAVPAFVLAAIAAWRQRDRLSMVVVAWCVGTYVPFVVLGRQHISYLYYMLSVLPGIYIGVARLFSGRYLPKAFTVVYALALLYGFQEFYPLKA
jgi:predicted membrane-bound dolichyl-phosphate-mannose-protein mannosyltransferase